MPTILTNLGVKDKVIDMPHHTYMWSFFFFAFALDPIYIILRPLAHRSLLVLIIAFPSYCGGL